MKHQVKILNTSFVTHDVKRFIVEKPKGYRFKPGQATMVAINRPKWFEKSRPFTFTSLNSDLVLEFIIKAYPERKGVTQKLHQLQAGDELLIENPWGTITYQGPGTFLAGGAGITPFIAIFRQLKIDQKAKSNRLLFSNKTAKDVILEKELSEIFGDQVAFTLTREKHPCYSHGRLDKPFLEKQIFKFEQPFYVCGPKVFVEDIAGYLVNFGAKTNSVVTEK